MFELSMFLNGIQPVGSLPSKHGHSGKMVLLGALSSML